MTWRRTENQRHGIGLLPAEATGDRSPAGDVAARFLNALVSPFVRQMPFCFTGRQPGCLLRVLSNGNSDVTVVAHGTKRIERPELALSRGAGRQVAVARISTISAKHEV